MFYASSYNSPVLYGLKLGGVGEITDRIVWETKKGAPHNPTPIVVGEEIYVVSDRGVAQCMGRKNGASPLAKTARQSVLRISDFRRRTYLFPR